MLLPLGTDRPLSRPTLVTYALIAANVLIFLGLIVYGRMNPDAADGIYRECRADPGRFRWWSLVTANFLHAGYRHLLGNMLILWVFGPNIEDRFGRLGFLVFYVLGGAAAIGLHVLFQSAPAVGASGAIAACTGAYLIMFPRTTVHVFSLLIYIGWTGVPAWWFIGLKVMWDVYAAGSRDGVAHLAHLGGYAYGMAVSLGLLWMKVLPREPYDLFTMGKQAYRRRQFREIGRQRDKAVSEHWSKAKGEGRSAKRTAQLEESDALAAARAQVTHLLATEDLPGAAAAYRSLADRFGQTPGATTLSRRQQYELANHLRAAGDHAAAAYAYERFLEGYPRDPEAPKIRLMLGLINSRDLNDPVRAKALLQEAIGDLRDGERDLAARELEALG